MSESENEHQGNHHLPIENEDDRFLRAMSGASFAPGATLRLPSGREISGEEAQAFIAAFERGEPGFGSEDDPYDDLDRDIVESYPIDPGLRERAMATVRRAPLPVQPQRRNPFVRAYRWLRDFRRR